MSKPTTIRLPDELIRELDLGASRAGMDRASYLRRLVQDGLRQDKVRSILAEYERGEVSAGGACEALGITPWEFGDLLKVNGVRRNVSFEDWLGSTRLLPARPSRRSRRSRPGH